MKECFRGVFPPAISAICFLLLILRAICLFITARVVRNAGIERVKKILRSLLIWLKWTICQAEIRPNPLLGWSVCHFFVVVVHCIYLSAYFSFLISVNSPGVHSGTQTLLENTYVPLFHGSKRQHLLSGCRTCVTVDICCCEKKRFTSRQEAFSEFKHIYGILQTVQPAYPRPPWVPVRSAAPVTHCDQLPCGPKQNSPSQAWHKHTYLQIQCLTKFIRPPADVEGVCHRCLKLKVFLLFL